MADPPELRLTGLHMNYSGRVAHRGRSTVSGDSGVQRDKVYAQITLRNATVGCIAARDLREVRILERQVANYEHPMAIPSDRRLHVVDALDDQGSGCSTEYSGFCQHVYVGVLPVQPWRLIRGELDAVLERAARIDESLGHVIAMAGGRHVGAVIVNVHRPARHSEA